MNKYIIYRHTSPEGLHYIWYTSQSLNQRSGSKGKHYQNNERFWNDIQRFGWDKFEHVILETCETLENAMQLEIKYISEYDSPKKKNEKEDMKLQIVGKITIGNVILKTKEGIVLLQNIKQRKMSITKPNEEENIELNT